MKHLKLVLAFAVVALLGGLGFLYSGLYPIGADDPHSKPVYWALETLREHSIAARTKGIEVPPLDDPEMLLSGGADYNEMCAGCHLKPGQASSELSQGLYPQPPNLSQALPERGYHPAGGVSGHGDAAKTAARQFWFIQHGIKASGMAAFGPTHDDARIWAMVAFLQKLPTLTPDQYQILTARAEGDMGDREGMGHDGHSHDEGRADTDAEAPVAGHSVMSGPADTAEAAVAAFQAALKSGDTVTAISLLSPDVLIYEGGGAERSRDEYAASHLAGDMAFLKTAQIEVLKRSSGGSGDMSWVNTESRIRGKSSKGRPLDVASTETALLRKTGDGWRITHLHWSSRDIKPAA